MPAQLLDDALSDLRCRRVKGLKLWRISPSVGEKFGGVFAVRPPAQRENSSDRSLNNMPDVRWQVAGGR